MFLASPTSLGLSCSFGFTLRVSSITLSWTDCLQRFWPCYTLLGLPGLNLKSQWKPSWSLTSCILHACKTSIKWTKPESATSLAVPWLLWIIVVIVLVSGWLNIMKQLPWYPCTCRSPQRQTLSSQGKVFQMILVFHTLEPIVGRDWTILEIPSRHRTYLLSWCKMLGFFLMGLTPETTSSLAQLYTDFSNKLCNFFQVFLFCFFHSILTINLAKSRHQ
jgi:hypothetical protein